MTAEHVLPLPDVGRMKSIPRTICVFGAGAIGGALAARLAVAPASSATTVSVIARGEHLAAIRRSGLQLWEKGDEKPTITRLRATDHPDELGEQDLIITALKGHQLPDAAHGIATLLGPETRVMMILNGIPWWYFHADRFGGHEGERINMLDPQAALWNLIGPQRVMGCVAYHGAEVSAPGQVRLTSEGRFAIGEPSGTLSPDLDLVAELLESARWTVTRTRRIRDEIWSKLLGNAAFNPVSINSREPDRDDRQRTGRGYHSGYHERGALCR
jgi:2-dehydropantoate 2-reductase